ncbi:hypothetical protein BZG36_05077 [Bifiguratus adelaidae]|uniref:HYDIN/VesB/CFA65-like Ig-like domain-containing protein n=1 Tax=Bifiguratus adelaidae TaxID=1938954 RepID=A0A261XTU8_9FUNG|nr:hypothetical protein BZG36_05077 [Bifiguratus adelaidae]
MNGGHAYLVDKFVRPAIGNRHVYVATSDARVIGFGSPVNPSLVASSLDIGSVTLGSSRTLDLVFTDKIATTVKGIIITQSDKSFAPGPGGPAFLVNVAPNQILTIPIIFSPQNVGLLTATVSLTTSTDPQGNSTSAAVSGTGVSAVPLFQVVSPVISFGNIVINTGPVSANLILTNAGNTTLNFVNIATTAVPFTVSGAPTPGQTLQVQSSMTIAISFNPTAVGSLSDTLKINSDGGNIVVPLTGSAVEDFGNATAGTTATLNLIVANKGGSVMAITRSKYPVNGPILPQTPIYEGTQLAPGSNITVAMVFTAPTAQIGTPPTFYNATWSIDFIGSTIGPQLLVFKAPRNHHNPLLVQAAGDI